MRRLVPSLLLLVACHRGTSGQRDASDATFEYCSPDPGFCVRIPSGYTQHTSTVAGWEREQHHQRARFFFGNLEHAVHLVTYGPDATWSSGFGPHDWRSHFDDTIKPTDVTHTTVLRREFLTDGHGSFGVTRSPIPHDATMALYDSLAILDLGDRGLVECTVSVLMKSGAPDAALIDACSTLRPR